MSGKFRREKETQGQPDIWKYEKEFPWVNYPSWMVFLSLMLYNYLNQFVILIHMHPFEGKSCGKHKSRLKFQRSRVESQLRLAGAMWPWESSPDISEPLWKRESSHGDSEKGQVRGECQEMLISFLQWWGKKGPQVKHYRKGFHLGLGCGCNWMSWVRGGQKLALTKV